MNAAMSDCIGSLESEMLAVSINFDLEYSDTTFVSIFIIQST